MHTYIDDIKSNDHNMNYEKQVNNLSGNIIFCSEPFEIGRFD